METQTLDDNLLQDQLSIDYLTEWLQEMKGKGYKYVGLTHGPKDDPDFNSWCEGEEATANLIVLD